MTARDEHEAAMHRMAFHDQWPWADQHQAMALRRLSAKRHYEAQRGSLLRFTSKVEHDSEIDWHRKRRREQTRQRRTSSLDDLLTEPSVPDFTKALAEADFLNNALNRLPKRDRNLMVLLFIHGYDRSEAAAILSRTEKTIAKQRERAISKLKTLVT